MQRDHMINRLYQLSAGCSVVPGVPLIEIIADHRVLIENHRGVHRYTREQICVQTSLGMIRIDGKKLFLEKMSKDQLTIIGKIDAVSLYRGGKNAG